MCRRAGERRDEGQMLRRGEGRPLDRSISAVGVSSDENDSFVMKCTLWAQSVVTMGDVDERLGGGAAIVPVGRLGSFTG